MSKDPLLGLQVLFNGPLSGRCGSKPAWDVPRLWLTSGASRVIGILNFERIKSLMQDGLPQ